jgi:serine/threonine protein phosphatase 1
MLPQQRQKVWHLPSNTAGRDFVVGDIHGCYDDLFVLLDHIRFDNTKDRLFSVGDMIDRGPDSKKCAELIYEPWFYATRANHEQMMIDLLSNGRFTPLVDYNEGAAWIPNGGAWSMSEDKGDLAALAQDLDRLPFVIVVGDGENRFHVLHAEIGHTENEPNNQPQSTTIYIRPHGARRVPVTDKMIDAWVFTEMEEYDMIWGRNLIQGIPGKWHDDTLSLTFVGHTPLRELTFVQRQLYLDHGAVFGRRSAAGSHDNKLAIAEPAAQVVHTMVITSGLLDTITDKFATVPFGDIQRLV